MKRSLVPGPRAIEIEPGNAAAQSRDDDQAGPIGRGGKAVLAQSLGRGGQPRKVGSSRGAVRIEVDEEACHSIVPLASVLVHERIMEPVVMHRKELRGSVPY